MFMMKVPFLFLAITAIPAIIADAYIVSSASTNAAGLSQLSVTELKRLLQERGVDFRDCLEKKDLVERLSQSRIVASSSSSSANHRPTSIKTDHEQQIIRTFQSAGPAVAFITTSPSASSRRNPFAPEPNQGGTGSGFLWDSHGHVVTNYHVIASNKSSSVSVKLQGMPDAMPATIVGVHPEKDLAVLKLPMRSTHLPKPIDVGSSEDLQVGQAVLAIGNPFGLDTTLTTGVVSALGRDIRGYTGRMIQNCVQTDASINPGNSGGPLLDSSGRLIGVNTMIYSPNGVGNVGIGFSIPVDTVRRVVNQLIRYGKVVRPSLGIKVVDDAIVRHIGQQMRRRLSGVLIADAFGGSAGKLNPSIFRRDGSIQLGDLIVAVDNENVQSVEDLLSIVEQRKVGDSVKVTVLRNCDPMNKETKVIRLASLDTSSE